MSSIKAFFHPEIQCWIESIESESRLGFRFRFNGGVGFKIQIQGFESIESDSINFKLIDYIASSSLRLSTMHSSSTSPPMLASSSSFSFLRKAGKVSSLTEDAKAGSS